MQAFLDSTKYETGVKVSDEDMEKINISRDCISSRMDVFYKTTNCLSYFTVLPKCLVGGVRDTKAVVAKHHHCGNA